MTYLDNHHHARDGCCVHSSCEREVLVIEDYYGMDDFTEEGGFQCEDDDIMVEVLGSDVYVDGVCGDGNAGDRCFAAGVASGGELDMELWPHGAVGCSGEGLESMWQGLDGRTESISVESSDRVSKEGMSMKNENLFSVSDLVWVMLKSHQWWPGQIVDPSEDLSEKAVGFRSKGDSFLLAYFGDRTFAWHEASSLKPFLNFFSKAVMQPNSEVFRNAVDCALVEFSRRVQLGLACPCLPENVLDKMRYPAIVNDETRKYLKTRDTADYSEGASSYKPEKLLKFIKRLACLPSDEVDPLDLVVTKAQLLCFYQHNGCDQLPEVQYGRALSEGEGDGCDQLPEVQYGRALSEGEGDGVYLKDEVMSASKERSVVPKSPRNFRHDWNDMDDCTRKESSLAKLMVDPGEFLEEAPSSRKKLRVHDPSISPCTEDVEKAISIANGISTCSSGMKPSLNIGESTQRFTSHVPGSLESNGERIENGECALLNGFEIFISESGDVQFPEHSLSDYLLEQLQFVADNPLEGHEESIVLNSGPSEIYQFEDTNDSYWTDRVIATNTQDQQYYEYEGEAMIEDSRKLGTLDRQPSTAKESSLEGDCLLVDDNSPAELILIFPKTGSFPVAATLNKTLKMFGPLKESETQVDRKSNRARVVFRKFGDAKAAFSSAQKYSIFGPLAVKYQLNHPISDP